LISKYQNLNHKKPNVNKRRRKEQHYLTNYFAMSIEHKDENISSMGVLGGKLPLDKRSTTISNRLRCRMNKQPTT